MSKELEALKILRQGSFDSYHSTSFEDIYHKEFEILNQALTPPTAEEVCKLLQDFLEIDKVHYGDNSFYSEWSNGIRDIISSYYINDNGEKAIYFNEELTPELTIEVCKFFKEKPHE